MSDDDKKKSKARQLADLAGKVSSAKQLSELIDDDHPARANLNHAQRLERAAMSEFKMNHPDPKVRQQMVDRFQQRVILENEIASQSAFIEQTQLQLVEAEQALFLGKRELTTRKQFLLAQLEDIEDEISRAEGFLEEIVPEGLWYDLSLIADAGAAADQDPAYDWQKSLAADEDLEQETYGLAGRLGELYDLRVEKAAEFRALQEQDPQDIQLVIEAERMAELRKGELEAMQKQLQDLLEQRDQARYDDDEWRQGLEALSAQEADTPAVFSRNVVEDEEQVRLQRQAIASEKAPPSPAENDRLIAQMEERFALERKQREAETAGNKDQLDRIETLLGSVMQQLSATKEENQQLKVQLAEQLSEPAEPSVKEASATVQVSFGVSAKAEFGKAKVGGTSHHRHFDKDANRDYWKDPRKRNTEWRIPFAERHWKARQSVMIRSGVDLFETPILKVRLATYFRQNVWNCEILNVGTGATALLGLGHGKFSTPVDDAPFVMTCLDTDDDWRQIEVEVMDELGYDKHQRLQKHECVEIRNEVLHRMNRAA
jgi:hypothetical protein